MKLFRPTIAFLILYFFSYNSFCQAFNNVSDYGYKGRIKSICTEYFPYLIDIEIPDTTKPRTVVTEYFNKDGNFTKRALISGIENYEFVYDYSNKSTISWKKIDHGLEVEFAKIEQNNNPGFTETVFEKLSTHKTFESIYTFGESGRTKTLVDKGYNQDGTLNFHNSTNFEDAEDGNIYKITTFDAIQNTTDVYEFIALEKDKIGNPVKILVKKNNAPFEIRHLTFIYE